jgi:hypothetical protein
LAFAEHFLRQCLGQPPVDANERELLRRYTVSLRAQPFLILVATFVEISAMNI